MFETQLAYHTNAWDQEYLIQAMSALARIGYRGIEVEWEVAESFLYRVDVFSEMLHHENLELAAVEGKLWLLGPGSEEEEKPRFLSMGQFALACGCQTIVVVPPRSWDEIDIGPEERASLVNFANETGRELAAMGGVLAFHPEVGTWLEKRKDITAFLEQTDPEAVFLCLDTAHCAHLKINPANFYAQHAERVRHVHLRDYRRTKTNHPFQRHLRSLGKGDVDFKALIRKLDQEGYSGWITVEYDARSDPDPTKSARTAYDHCLEKLDLGL